MIFFLFLFSMNQNNRDSNNPNDLMTDSLMFCNSNFKSFPPGCCIFIEIILHKILNFQSKIKLKWIIQTPQIFATTK